MGREGGLVPRELMRKMQAALNALAPYDGPDSIKADSRAANRIKYFVCSACYTRYIWKKDRRCKCGGQYVEICQDWDGL